jgi:hypothetical protein
MKATLEYNGKEYDLREGDIPRISGDGRIVITNKPGCQVQDVEGLEDVNMIQAGGSAYINGVNVERLVSMLEARKAGERE